jgi:hypothetical protein
MRWLLNTDIVFGLVVALFWAGMFPIYRDRGNKITFIFLVVAFVAATLFYRYGINKWFPR